MAFLPKVAQDGSLLVIFVYLYIAMRRGMARAGNALQ